MYEGLRLTELHEEWAWAAHKMRETARLGGRDVYARRADLFDGEIRARVAATPLPRLLRPGNLNSSELFFRIPDAEREYPKKRVVSYYATNGVDPLHFLAGEFPSQWGNHAWHAVPVEGCHLCHLQPTRWTPGGFVHEEHIPGEGRR